MRTFKEDSVFPGSSAGKESACNTGDLGSIPGSGRSTRKGIGYLLQYSWASLVVQLVKNPPAVWETWVRSLGWEDPLKKGIVTHYSILAWRIPRTLQSMGSQRVRQLSNFHCQYLLVVVLCVHCFVWSFSSCGRWGLLFIVVHGLLSSRWFLLLRL